MCTYVFLTNKHCCWHTNYSWRGWRQGEFANYRVDSLCVRACVLVLVCVCVRGRVSLYQGERVWVHEPNQGISRRQLARLDLIPV